MTYLDDVRAARAGRDHAEAEFRATCLKALRNEIPVARVARAAGVSRDTLYAWKRQAEAAEEPKP